MESASRDGKGYLCIKRRAEESLYIKCGEDIVEIIVTHIKPSQVSLAISADKNKFKILRKEALEKAGVWR